MNPTLYNAQSGMIATPLPNVTPQQQSAATAQGFNQTISPQSSQPLSSQNLAPTSPLTIPNTPTPTSAAAITGATDAQLSSELNQRQTTQQNTLDKSQSDYQNTINQILGIQSSRAQVEQNANIPQLSQLANDSFTALERSKRAQQQEVQALQNSGVTGAGLDAATRDINRKYANEQADLSIAYDVANRNYTNAQATVDRKIQLQLEPLQTLLNFQKDFYQQNKDALTKTEDRQFQLLIQNNDRAYQRQQTVLKTLEDTKLELLKNAASQNAPTSVIQSIQDAQTPGEATAAAGQYAAANKYSFQTITDAFGNQHVVAMSNLTGQPVGSSSVNDVNNGTSTSGYNAPQNSAYKNAFEQVVQGKAPVVARPQRAQLDALLSSGNYEGAKEYLLSAALEKFGPTETTNALGRMTAIDALTNIQNQLNTLKAQGVSTNLLTGNAEQVAQKLGASTDPRLAAIGNQIALAYNTYRKAMTGVAFSPQEAAQYQKLFPQITNLDSLNTTKINSLIDAFKQQQKTVVSAAIGQSNYDKIYGDQTSQTDIGNKIRTALSSGYSEDQILNQLKTTALSSQIQQALDAGYSTSTIIKFLSQ